MKTIIICAATVFFLNQGYSQIGVTKIADAKVSIELYDSIKNFVGENITYLIGQELYLMPLRPSLQRAGYQGFVKDYRITNSMDNNSNVYKCCDGYGSKYNELAGKYFQVLDVFDHPEKEKYPESYKTLYYIKLKEKTLGDILYSLYDSRYENAFQFIVVGYFKKKREAVLGTEFVLRGKPWRETTFHEDTSMYDIVTGKKIKLEAGSIWKIVDLSIEDKFYSLSYIIQDKNGQKLSIDIALSNNTSYMFKKYDVELLMLECPEYWGDILKGKIVEGMTEDMVKLSWGRPDKIYRKENGTQWKYGTQTINFIDGLLTSFN